MPASPGRLKAVEATRARPRAVPDLRLRRWVIVRRYALKCGSGARPLVRFLRSLPTLGARRISRHDNMGAPDVQV